MIRPVRQEDKTDLLRLCEATGLFVSEEIDELGNMLDEYFDHQLGEDHFWITYEDNGLLGVAYYAPEKFADRIWNLYLIGIAPKAQRKGLGTELLRFVENHLIERGERILIIETSGLGSFERTRAFYRKNGYTEEARLRDWYREGDDKVIFLKQLNR